MKKRILCLLLALMLALLAFSLVSCGDNDDDDDDDDRKSSSSKNDEKDETKEEVTFDDVLELFEDIESEESGVMLNTFEGEDEAKSALESSFGGDILDDFDGELKNALLCNYIGDSNFWVVMVFECGDEKDAESLAEWLDKYNEEDDTYYTAENGLFIIATSEYMIDVVLGEEEYEWGSIGNSDGGSSDSGATQAKTVFESYVSNMEGIEDSYVDAQYFVGDETTGLARSMFGYDFAEEFENCYRNGAWFGGEYVYEYQDEAIWVVGIFEFEDDMLIPAVEWLSYYNEEGYYYTHLGNVLLVASDAHMLEVARGYEGY